MEIATTTTIKQTKLPEESDKEGAAQRNTTLARRHRPRDRSTEDCYWCGLPGHIARYCPTPARPGTAAVAEGALGRIHQSFCCKGWRLHPHQSVPPWHRHRKSLASLRPRCCPSLAEAEDMLRAGIIEPSNSPWAAPALLIRQKDGTWCFCVDYRRLNNVTQKDSYP